MVATRERGGTGRRSLERVAPAPQPNRDQAEPGDLVGYGGYIYQIVAIEGDRAHLQLPGTIYPGYRAMLGTSLSLAPTNPIAPLEALSTYPKQPKPEPVPLQTGEELQIGSIVRKGSSLGQWVIVELNGATAKVRQLTGYAQNMLVGCNLSELKPWTEEGK
jgi:hypothetical protein